MKKFLSILFAAAMLVAVFSVNVLADPIKTNHPDSDAVKDRTQEVYWVIGEQGKNEDINNGVTEFDPTAVSSDIKVNFNTNNNNGGNPNYAIQERYAIDIDYKDLIFDLAEISRSVTPAHQTEGVEAYKYIWNVNTHKYELRAVNSDGDIVPDVTVTDDFADAISIDDAFVITNHSSLPIYYDAKVDYVTGINSFMSIEIHYNGASANNIDTQKIDRCLVDAYTPPTASHAISAKPSNSGVWTDVINELATSSEHTSGISVIATLTIQFATEEAQAGFS